MMSNDPSYDVEFIEYMMNSNPLLARQLLINISMNMYSNVFQNHAVYLQNIYS